MRLFPTLTSLEVILGIFNNTSLFKRSLALVEVCSHIVLFQSPMQITSIWNDLFLQYCLSPHVYLPLAHSSSLCFGVPSVRLFQPSLSLAALPCYGFSAQKGRGQPRSSAIWTSLHTVVSYRMCPVPYFRWVFCWMFFSRICLLLRLSGWYFIFLRSLLMKRCSLFTGSLWTRVSWQYIQDLSDF